MFENLTARLHILARAAWGRFIGPTKVGVWYRKRLELTEIHSRFYADTPITLRAFSELQTELAECLRLPSEVIRPKDRIFGDLAVPSIVSPVSDDLAEAADARNAKLATPVDPSCIVTVDDYVRAFAATATGAKET